MDGESVAEELLLLEHLSDAHDACVLGKYHNVPGWKGTCIGDCAATVSDKVLRVVAFQGRDAYAKSTSGSVMQYCNYCILGLMFLYFY